MTFRGQSTNKKCKYNVIESSTRKYETNLIHKFRKPLICHDPEAFITCWIAPGVLYTPSDWFSSFIKVNTREHHGMSHKTFTIQQTLFLGHAKLGVESKSIIINLGIHDSQRIIGELTCNMTSCSILCSHENMFHIGNRYLLTNITSKPNRLARLQCVDSQSLHCFNIDIHIANWLSSNHIA